MESGGVGVDFGRTKGLANKLRKRNTNGKRDARNIVCYCCDLLSPQEAVMSAICTSYGTACHGHLGDRSHEYTRDSLGQS